MVAVSVNMQAALPLTAWDSADRKLALWQKDTLLASADSLQPRMCRMPSEPLGGLPFSRLGRIVLWRRMDFSHIPD